MLLAVPSLKELSTLLLCQTSAGGTKDRNCFNVEIQTCLKGRELSFKILLSKWYYTFVKGFAFQKKKKKKKRRHGRWSETLYANYAVKGIPNVFSRSLPAFHECIQGRQCCISFSLSLFLTLLCNGREPEKCLSWSMQSLV